MMRVNWLVLKQGMRITSNVPDRLTMQALKPLQEGLHREQADLGITSIDPAGPS